MGLLALGLTVREIFLLTGLASLAAAAYLWRID